MYTHLVRTHSYMHVYMHTCTQILNKKRMVLSALSSLSLSLARSHTQTHRHTDAHKPVSGVPKTPSPPLCAASHSDSPAPTVAPRAKAPLPADSKRVHIRRHALQMRINAPAADHCRPLPLSRPRPGLASSRVPGSISVDSSGNGGAGREGGVVAGGGGGGGGDDSKCAGKRRGGGEGGDGSSKG